MIKLTFEKEYHIPHKPIEHDKEPAKVEQGLQKHAIRLPNQNIRGELECVCVCGWERTVGAAWPLPISIPIRRQHPTEPTRALDRKSYATR